MTGAVVARVADVPAGKMIGAVVDGQKILLANVDGQIHAMRSVCNHMGGALEKGALNGRVVTCPLHGSEWDVTTGKLVHFRRPLPPEPIFKVVISGDEVLVER